MNLVDPAAVGRLCRLGLAARLPMSGQMSGQHQSPHRGSSVEFAEYRKYAPGDDIRLLDWRVYARSDRFYIKEFEADTNLRAYLVMDGSGSMGFGEPGTTKLAYAAQLAATLAYLAVQQGDAVGLTCVREKVEVEIPARRRPAHLRTIFDELEKMEATGKTALAPALHTLAEKIPQRSLVLVFSDGFSDVEELLASLQHAAFRRHDVVFFQLLHREEVAFAVTQPTRFLDLESAFGLLAEPEIIRAQYLESFARHNDRLKIGCRESRIEYRRVITDQDYEKVLADFLRERQRTR